MADEAWTVRGSTHPFRTPWFSVRADDCITSAGVEVSPYYALEFPDFVHVLATSGDKVVLVRQYRHAYGAWSLELSGGIVDPGESDLLAVGARELREETGYCEGAWSYRLALSVDPARYANRLHLVRAEGVVAGAACPEPTETIETVLIPRTEALRLARTGRIINAAHAGMLLMTLE